MVVVDDAPREPVTPDKVLDAALAIVETDGVPALSMRRLAGDLGVGTPSLYWHVGGRLEILAQLIDRVTKDFGNIRPVGDTPAERIVSVCRALLDEVRRRPHLIELSVTAGRGEAIFVEAQQVLAREVFASGLRGHDAAVALRMIVFQLGGFIVMDYGVGRDTSLHAVDRWHLEDPEFLAELAQPVDLDELFTAGLEAILARLLPPDPGAL